MKKVKPNNSLLTAATTMCMLMALAGCKNEESSPFIPLDNGIAYRMNELDIPAVSIAIVKDEKLVYVKSYGLANKEINRVASPDDLYRIASVSKPVTAIAILKLVQDGRLSLDQTVFGEIGVLGNDFGAPPPGSNKELITIRHLLDHTSGWTNSPDDPVFAGNLRTRTEIVTELLANRPLASVPGKTYYYLNFGYSVLGRVIEKATGMDYEDHVKTAILKPCGITEMKIGKSTYAERYAHEVKYYQDVYDPYGIYMARAEAAAGWIASATDLARLMVKIDRNPERPDLISPDLLNQFYFGRTAWEHYGGMAGTSAIFKRVDDTYSFVLLANTRRQENLEALDNTVTQQIHEVMAWPSRDLF